MRDTCLPSLGNRQANTGGPTALPLILALEGYFRISRDGRTRALRRMKTLANCPVSAAPTPAVRLRLRRAQSRRSRRSPPWGRGGWGDFRDRVRTMQMAEAKELIFWQRIGMKHFATSLIGKFQSYRVRFSVCEEILAGRRAGVQPLDSTSVIIHAAPIGRHFHTLSCEHDGEVCFIRIRFLLAGGIRASSIPLSL